MKRLLPLLYASPLILISIAIGYGISVFSNINWPSSSLFSAAGLLLVGTWIFEDDANVMADDQGKTNAEIKDIKTDIRKSNIIGYSLVTVLVVCGTWLQLSI